ncbi:MAG: hypothetical protein WC059_02220 [Candidatus Paceibacterota bacterium]
MRSIEARFNRYQIKEPWIGAYIHLARAVSNQKFSRKNLGKSFNELMPKDEYRKLETRQLVRYLYKISNPSEEVEKSTKNHPRQAVDQKLVSRDINEPKSPCNQ